MRNKNKTLWNVKTFHNNNKHGGYPTWLMRFPENEWVDIVYFANNKTIITSLFRSISKILHSFYILHSTFGLVQYHELM